MELTRQAAYAIRCVLETTRHERISTAELARRQHIPLGFLTKIVGGLARVGILETRRGAGGGVRLGRPADEITVLEVIEAAQGPVRLNLCIGLPATCEVAHHCPVSRVCDDAQEAVTSAFSVTFADLCADLDRAELAGPHPEPEDLAPAENDGEPDAALLAALDEEAFREPVVVANGHRGSWER
jgi:Rrf2 family transcriptional regulator, iron-sulfur cluster assembly transcription factor